MFNFLYKLLDKKLLDNATFDKKSFSSTQHRVEDTKIVKKIKCLFI